MPPKWLSIEVRLLQALDFCQQVPSCAGCQSMPRANYPILFLRGLVERCREQFPEAALRAFSAVAQVIIAGVYSPTQSALRLIRRRNYGDTSHRDSVDKSRKGIETCAGRVGDTLANHNNQKLGSRADYAWDRGSAVCRAGCRPADPTLQARL